MARQRVWKRNKIDFSQQMQTCAPLQIQILCVPLKPQVAQARYMSSFHVDLCIVT